MLPAIPQSMAPVTAQQDVIKPRPDIAPVMPIQNSAKETALSLDKRHAQEAEELLRDEQRRGYTPEQLAAGEVGEADEAEIDDLPRQGVWVDLEV